MMGRNKAFKRLEIKRNAVLLCIGLLTFLSIVYVLTDFMLVAQVPLKYDSISGLPYLDVVIAETPCKMLIGFSEHNDRLSSKSSQDILNIVRKSMGYYDPVKIRAQTSVGHLTSDETFGQSDSIPSGFDGALSLSFFVNSVRSSLNHGENLRLTLDFKRNVLVCDCRPWRSELKPAEGEVALTLKYDIIESDRFPFVETVTGTVIRISPDLDCNLSLTDYAAKSFGFVVPHNNAEWMAKSNTQSSVIEFNTSRGSALFHASLSGTGSIHSTLGFREMKNKIFTMDFRDGIMVMTK